MKNPVVCPAVLAPDEAQYKEQMLRVTKFAHRIQIDLTDGEFASLPTVTPQQAWWPVGVKADFHLMFKRPLEAAKTVLEHHPNLVIFHAEAEGKFADFVELCKKHDTKVGLALLKDTPVSDIVAALEIVDHVLIFSGDLGQFGGQADLNLLSKVYELKERKPEIEIGWDGGVNDQNIAELILGGVDVLNTGGFIQKAEDPEKAYQNLSIIADETGTT